MENKTKEKLVKSGFKVLKTYEGQRDFDTDYVDIEIRQVVKKVGEGEEDFVLIDKEIKSLTPIREFIQSQSDLAGIEQYLRAYANEGINILDNKAHVDENVNDFTNMPEDLAGAAAMGDNLVNLFNQIDPALKGDAKTPEEFFANLTVEKFNEYINSMTKKKEEEVNE